MIKIVLAFIALLASAVCPASAVTFVPLGQLYDFGPVPHGEMREEILIYDTSPFFYTFYYPDGTYTDTYPDQIGKKEVWVLYGPVAFSNTAFNYTEVDCSAYTTSRAVCFNVKITSFIGVFPISELGFLRQFLSYALLEDGTEAYLGGNESSGHSRVSFVPVPVPLPAAFPLFATALAGMGLLGWRRKRKAGVRA